MVGKRRCCVFRIHLAHGFYSFCQEWLDDAISDHLRNEHITAYLVACPPLRPGLCFNEFKDTSLFFCIDQINTGPSLQTCHLVHLLLHGKHLGQSITPRLHGERP